MLFVLRKKWKQNRFPLNKCDKISYCTSTFWTQPLKQGFQNSLMTWENTHKLK